LFAASDAYDHTAQAMTDIERSQPHAVSPTGRRQTGDCWRGQANFFLAPAVPEIIPLSRTTGTVVPPPSEHGLRTLHNDCGPAKPCICSNALAQGTIAPPVGYF